MGDSGRDADRFLADAVLDAAVDARRREGWLRSRAAEDATFVGVLAAAAEQGGAVTLRTAWARRDGTIARIGADHVEFVTAGGCRLVALDAISAVETSVTGPGPARHGDATLADRLADAVDAWVHCVDRAGQVLASGRLVAAGTDVIVVRDEGGRLTAVAVQALGEAAVGSG